MLVNAIRAHMAEFGIVAPVGIPGVKELFAVIADAAQYLGPPADADPPLPVARPFKNTIGQQETFVATQVTLAYRTLRSRLEIPAAIFNPFWTWRLNG